jgi:hypothetical protein
MRRPTTSVVRFVALVMLFTALAAVFATAPTPQGPYSSALSNLALGAPVQAAACHNKACNTTTDQCEHNPNTNCGVKGSICAITRAC